MKKKVIHKEVRYTAMGDEWVVTLCTNLPTGVHSCKWREVNCFFCLKHKPAKARGGKHG